METPAPILLDNIAYGIHTSGLAPMIYDTVLPEQVSDTTLVTSSIHFNTVHDSSSQYYNSPVISSEEPKHMSSENMRPMIPVDRTYENILDVVSRSMEYPNQTVTLL